MSSPLPLQTPWRDASGKQCEKFLCHIRLRRGRHSTFEKEIFPQNRLGHARGAKCYFQPWLAIESPRMSKPEVCVSLRDQKKKNAADIQVGSSGQAVSYPDSGLLYT